MTAPVSFGYLTPELGMVQASPWIITADAHEPVSDPDQIENWHYATALTVERTLTLDPNDIREVAGLGRRDRLRAVLTWTSTATQIQGCSESAILEDGANALRLPLPSGLLGGSLVLRTIVAVEAVEPNRNPLAAHRTGSVLWSDDRVVALEGDASRFPTEALSFSASGLGSDSVAWRLDIDTSDLEALALNCVRVLLNTDNAVYRRLIDSPASSEAEATRKFLQYDIARQLSTAGLAQDDFVPIQYERGTIGAVLRARLSDYFGEDGAEIEPLRARWRSAPNEIDAELQTRFEL